jgi:hypothetical protein
MTKSPTSQAVALRLVQPVAAIEKARLQTFPSASCSSSISFPFNSREAKR